MPLIPSAFRCSNRRKKTSGFALVIALSLMAFILLLLLSLTTLVRVEVTSSNTSMMQLEAESNALLALNVALGELQAYAGPDQRATATADLAARNRSGDRIDPGSAPANDLTRSGSDNGLAALSEGTRYWTGVWQDANAPEDIFTTNPEPRLLNWLVSGNHGATIEFTPDLGITLHSDTLKYSLDNNEEAVLLVGAGSAGSTAASATYLGNYGIDSPDAADVETAADRYVVAPLVPLDDDTGAFAYWVGDEGVKARYNLVDDYADSSSAADVRMRYRSPPRVAAEMATAADLAQPSYGSGKVDFSNTPVYNYDSYPFPANRADDVVASLPSVYSLDQADLIHFANPAVTDERLKKRFHALSTYSEGLLTNSLFGGLKQDLSLALENDADFSAMFPDDRILPAAVTPDSGPNWSTIQAFYDLADRGSDAIDLDDPAATDIYPSIAELRLIGKIYPNRATGTWEVRVGLAVGIANPYAVPLTTDGLILKLDRLGLNPATGNYRELGRAENPDIGAWRLFAIENMDNYTSSNLNDRRNEWRANVITSFKLTDAPSNEGSSVNNGILTRPETSFSIPATTWEPGELLMFGIADRSQTLGTGAVNLVSLDDAPRDTHYARFDTGVPLPNEDPDDTQYDAWLDFVLETEGYGTTSPTGIAIELYGSASAEPIIRAEPLNLYIGNPVIPRITGNTDFEGGVLGGSLHIYLTLPYAEELTWIPAIQYQLDSRTPYGARPFIDRNLRAKEHIPGPFLTEKGQIGTYFHYAGKRTTNATDFTENSPWDWGGSFTASGESAHPAVSLYDIPRRVDASEVPFISLAQLQHVDLTADDRSTGISHQNGLAVGNSFFSPLIDRQLSIQTRTADVYTPPLNLRLFDLSYLLNTQLFDQYFFSSYPGGALPDRLPNQHYRIANRDSFLANAGGSLPGTGPAESIRVEGAFNVNSTNPDAWASVLASTIRVPVAGDDPGKGTAFPRSLNPEGTSEQARHGDAPDSYNGYRRLTDQEIRELAWEMVRQVRQRGPFTSLAQFVNRALVPASSTPLAPPASHGLSGALQSAIDNTAINRLPGLSEGDQVTSRGGGLADTAWFPDAAQDYPALTSASGSDGRSPWGNHLSGIPGILTQADVLQIMAPMLASRSDTFKIRTYGEAKDLDGSTLAEAWVEAVVQREPAYVDPGDEPGANPDALSSLNQKFGRGMRIVSFRWLTKDEI